jgi:hypothetical protein
VPNPDITTGSAAGGAGRVPGRPSRPKPKPKPKKPRVPQAVGRPAPRSPAKVKPVQVRVPKIAHPIDEVALRRQRLMRTLGHPIATDGQWGPRSRAAWNQVGLPEDGWDRARKIEDLAARGGAQQIKAADEAQQGIYDRTTNTYRPLNPSENLAKIHALIHEATPAALKAAQNLAQATGVMRPGEKVQAAVTRTAFEMQAAEITRTHEAAIDRALHSGFKNTDDLTLARIAARDVKAPGLSSLNGDDLAWLMKHDARSPRPRFHTVVEGQNGPVAIPTPEFVRGLQGYANRMGVRIGGGRILEDGRFDARTNDALIRAAEIEQHEHEMEGYRDLKAALVDTGAWSEAQVRSGVRMDFSDAWREVNARKGGSWAALTLMAAAVVTAREQEPERVYRELRMDAFDAAQIFASGVQPRYKQKGPFAGTPYGLQEDAPGMLALASGVPAAVAFSQTRQHFDAYRAYAEMMEAQRHFKEEQVRGTVENDTVEYLVRRQVVPVLNSDGTPRMTRTRFGTWVPVTESRKWTDPSSAHIVVHKGFRQLLQEGRYGEALAGFPQAALAATPTAPFFEQTMTGLHHAGRPAEWVTLQVVAATMQARDVFSFQAMTDLKQSIQGGWMAGTRRDHDYDRQARLWFESQGFWTQMALTALFDPLNFAGRGLKGVAVFGRSMERYAFRHSVDETPERVLATHGPSIISDDDLQKVNREISAELAGPEMASPARAQFQDHRVYRTAVNQKRRVARALGFKGVRGVKPEQLDEVTQWQKRAAAGMRADPSSMHSFRLALKHKMSFWVDEGMEQMTKLGVAEYASRMVAARPAMLRMLRDEKFSEELVRTIDDYVFGMQKGGGLPPGVAQSVERIEREFDNAIRGSMEVIERELRNQGGYQFIANPKFTYADGAYKNTYYGPDLHEVPEVSAYYRELQRSARGGVPEGVMIEVRNPAFGIPMTAEEMEISIAREVRTLVRERMGDARAEYERTGRMFDEDELARRAAVYEQMFRTEVQSHWTPGGKGTRAQQVDAQRKLEVRHDLALRARDGAKAMRDHAIAERTRRQVELANLVRREGLTGKLAHAMSQLGLKGRLEHALSEPTDTSLEDLGLTPDEALVMRARRAVEDHVGSFDPRMAVDQFGTPEMLDALHDASGKILRDLHGGEIPMAFNAELYFEAVVKYLDAEHPHVRRRILEFKPGQKDKPHAVTYRKGTAKITTWKPENAGTAAVALHEIAHTMATTFGAHARVGDFDKALWDELVTSLIAMRLGKELFPYLDEESESLFTAFLAKGFSTYYYSEPVSGAEAMLAEAAQGFMGFSADEVRPFVQWIADMDADMPVLDMPDTTGMTKAEIRAVMAEARAKQQVERHIKAVRASDKVSHSTYQREQAIKAGLLDHEVQATKDMEPAMRDTLAHAMTAGLARRGLVLSDDNIEAFFGAVSREGLDVRLPDTFKDLVGNLRYRHPEVQAAFAQLDEADELATAAFDRYFWAREHRTVGWTELGLMKEESKAATDNYWKASDRVFSRLLRLLEPDYLERMALEFEQEYAKLRKIASPTAQQKMVAIIHRASARSLRGFLAQGDLERSQISEVNRAVTMLHREIVGLQRDVRLHHSAYLSAARTERGLRHRMREMGSAPAGTFFDSRETVQIDQAAQVGTRADEVGRINDAVDGVAWAQNDMMSYGRDDARPRKDARPEERVGNTIDVTDPRNMRDDVYVDARSFTVDPQGIHRFHGKLHEGYGLNEEGKRTALPLPLAAIPVSDLTSDQLFVMFASEQVMPNHVLKMRPKQLFYGDETASNPNAYVQIPKFRKGQVKYVRVSTENLRRGVPPEIGEEIRADIQRQVEAGVTLDTLDTTIIEELAKRNPRYDDSIHLFAHRQTVGMAMRGLRHAEDVADKAAMPTMLAERGLYLSALSFHSSRTARVAYATLNGSLQLWKLATLPLSMMWLVANVIDNFAKRLITGLVDPKEMVLAPVRTGAKATAMLAHFSVAAIYQGAKQGDAIWGTDVVEQLDRLLRAVTDYDVQMRNSFLRAHDIEVPDEVLEGGFGVYMSSPLDVAKRRWDPLDWKAPWRYYREEATSAWDKTQALYSAFSATVWHMTGNLPETAARRAAYNVAYRKGIRDGLSVQNAVAGAIAKVNHTLFDYNDIKVGEENLRLLFPFGVYFRKNLAFWLSEIPQHPWMVSNLQRMEDYRSDPALPEGKDPLARYFDITGIVDDLYGHLGIEVPDGVAFDPIKLSSIRILYELMFSSQNPNMPPDSGGIEMVNRIVGYFDDIGLGINPYLRAGMQGFDIYKAQSWRSIFPQTTIVEGLSRSWWHERFPNGINIERFLQDPLYEQFHDGQSLSDLREADINYYVQVEMARQASAGQQISRKEAEDSVRGFFGVAALVQLTTGIFLRRMNEQDRELLRIRQLARSDFNAMTPHQMAVNTVDRERFKTQEMMDRAVEAYPLVQLYYRTSDWKQRNKILEMHPEISPYVQRTRARALFENPGVETAHRQRRNRDQILSTQRGLVAQIYSDLRQSNLTGEARSRLYNAMLTPELREYLARTGRPQTMADAFVKGEYYGYVNKVSEAFHDIPETDYARRNEFLARNPYLEDYWTFINPPAEDGVSIANAANAAYRDWYFQVKETAGWDEAAFILEGHPQMFDRTRAAGKVDRSTGRWLPKSMGDLERHAADYRRMKPLLDEYFNTPKGAREYWLKGHPEVLRYFKMYGADRQYRRRRYRRHAVAHASAPWASRRAEFWHRFFQLDPDARLDYIKNHAADYDVFSWGPTADSQFKANAHAFAWGDTARRDAYKQVAALMQVYFELKPEDRGFFLSANPEIAAYFDEFKRGSITGDKKLDKVLEAYFKQPGKDAQRAYLDDHPELKAYFTKQRKTPEEKAIGVLLDAYFGLPEARRPDYLILHPELTGFFEERRRQQDLIDAYDDALTEADPRYRRYRQSEQYQRAMAEIHLRRASLRANASDRATKQLARRVDRAPDPATVRRTRQPTS